MKSIRLSHLLVIFVIGLILTAPIEGSAEWWDKLGEPQYGGSITLRANEFFSLQFDPWGPPSFSGTWLMHYDCLFSYDWTVDRKEWPFELEYVPEKYISGSVVESWEYPDNKTVLLHLRKGVLFQDKEPVNGRELTAQDIVYHFDRLCGTGSGFTKPSPFAITFPRNFQGAYAKDKYTVELKFKNPSLINQFPLFRMGGTGYVEAPEVSKNYGDCADWKNAVGTGPWILKEYIEGSTLNFIKNPNYWGHDERYPDNRLPYADKLTVICIQDEATAMAALRTGKIDILKGVHWKKAETLKKSNPALKQALLSEPGNGILLNLFNIPFTDVKVRKALNMAFNRELIAKVHYGGLIEGKPCGIISSLLADYSTPFEEWPKDLQKGYSFNPEAARKLLAEAGYPNGFSTSCVTSSSHDLELLQILKSMFSDIGVDVEIQSMDRATYTNITMTGKHKGMAGPEPQGFNVIGTPWENLQMRTSNAPNPSTFKDPVYDAMCAEFNNILDPTKLAQQVKDADRYIMERYTSVLVLPNIDYNIWQPYLKGYSGERLNNMGYYARWWIGDK